MKKNAKLIIIISVIFLFILSLVAFGDDQKSELIFSHKLHVEEMGMDCLSCHQAAETSKTGKDNLMPTMESCGNCHDVESTDNCGMCHSDLENMRAVPRVKEYSVFFSHEQHIEAELECLTCHEEVAEKEQVEPYILPPEVSCQECHSQRRVMPSTHGPDFIHSHAEQARTSEAAMRASQSCNTCHKNNFCQNCHEGDNLDRTTHPLNYAFTHSLDAQGQERECAACHTDRSFCNDCHAQFQVMPHNHTAGWVNNIPGDGGRHRIEAQNDLENCMACHEQNAQQICQTCHSK